VPRRGLRRRVPPAVACGVLPRRRARGVVARCVVASWAVGRGAVGRGAVARGGIARGGVARGAIARWATVGGAIAAAWGLPRSADAG